MNLADKFVTLDEIAAAVGRSTGWFMRHHRRLSREQGMPEKCCLGWVWPRRRMEEWIDGTYGRAIVEEVESPACVPRMVANQNERLRARYARAGA